MSILSAHQRHRLIETVVWIPTEGLFGRVECMRMRRWDTVTSLQAHHQRSIPSHMIAHLLHWRTPRRDECSGNGQPSAHRGHRKQLENDEIAVCIQFNKNTSRVERKYHEIQQYDANLGCIQIYYILVKVARKMGK